MHCWPQSRSSNSCTDLEPAILKHAFQRTSCYAYYAFVHLCRLLRVYSIFFCRHPEKHSDSNFTGRLHGIQRHCLSNMADMRLLSIAETLNATEVLSSQSGAKVVKVRDAFVVKYGGRFPSRKRRPCATYQRTATCQSRRCSGQ
jgi:hypothetical protein